MKVSCRCRYVCLVRADALARIARRTDLPSRLSMAVNEGAHGGTANVNILADALEAAIGAIFLDGGHAAAEAIVRRLWTPELDAEPVDVRDPKTRLQEWAQGRGLPLPEYVLVSAEGPSHAPLFVVEVRVRDLPPMRAEAGIKKQAERLAAEKLLATLV